MTIYVEGMSCQHCQKTVENLTKKFAKGKVEVDLKEGSVHFEAKKDFDKALYIKALEEMGYDAN